MTRPFTVVSSIPLEISSSPSIEAGSVKATPPLPAPGMIERGKSFEEVAQSYFPNLPEGQKPWDLGFLAFYKIPEPWRDTLTDLKPGEMSGILRGPSERFWLIKLVETKEDTALTFESAREGILQDMRAMKVSHVREGLEKELRAAAKVEMVSPP